MFLRLLQTDLTKPLTTHHNSHSIMKWSITALIAVAVSLIAVAVGALPRDGIVISLALFSALTSLVLASVPDSRFGPKALAVSILVLLVALAMDVWLSYDVTVVEKGVLDVHSWALMASVMYTIPLSLLVLQFMQALAVRFGASYNWALVSALFPFCALGMISLGFALTYLIQEIVNVRPWVTNSYLGWCVAVPLLASVIVAIAISLWMRKKGKIINANGMVSRI